MRNMIVLIGAGAVALAAAVSGAAVARTPEAHKLQSHAQSSRASEESSSAVTGSDADHAKAAALKATGGGRANAVERDSENGATWEVEVTKTNGRTVDVRLDKEYRVVAVEDDADVPPDTGNGSE